MSDKFRRKRTIESAEKDTRLKYALEELKEKKH